MIFAKSSTRTRVSFEVGTYQLGGHALFLSARDIQLGRGEPISDMARVLSRYVDGIMIRTFAHADVEELAQLRHRAGDQRADRPHASLPGPGRPADGAGEPGRLGRQAGVAWIGDGNNMANSWIDAAAVLGFELRLACPEGYDPDPALLERARASADQHPDHASPRGGGAMVPTW